MAKVTKTQVVKFIRKGEKGDPAVNIIVGSDTVVFTKSGQAAKITLQVFIGDRQLNYGDGTNDTFVCSTLGNSHYLFDGKVYWNYKVEDDNRTFNYLFNLQEKADLSEVVNFVVTVNGVSYKKTLTIKTVYDGTDGISVMLSQDNIVHKKSEYVSTYTINISLIDKVAVAPSGYSINIESFPVGITPQILQNGTDGYKLMVGIQPTATWDTTIPITLIITYGTYKITRLVYVSLIEDGADGGKGERGATLRGPQDWEKINDGYQFYSGADDEPYLDCVVYKGFYYMCKKSHTKNSLNCPGITTGNNNKYWRLGDKIDLVATKLLLSEYICVEHLGAEAIEMKDKEGNLVFFAKGGNVTCLTGTFENVNISGYLYKSKTVIDDSNLDSYLDKESPYAADGSNVLDLKKAGTWIEFQKNATAYIAMPSIYPDVQTYTEAALMQTRSMIGNTVIMYNKGKSTVQITGRLKSTETGSGVSTAIRTGEFIYLTCMATSTDGLEDVYWLYRRGKANVGV